MELLDLLQTSEVVTIGTATTNGKVITTPVGVVVDGKRRYPVIFELVTDAETIRQADSATVRKYGGALRSLILRPLLWRTKQHLVRITQASDYPTAANTESG
jgi:hypothetical protein